MKFEPSFPLRYYLRMLTEIIGLNILLLLVSTGRAQTSLPPLAPAANRPAEVAFAGQEQSRAPQPLETKQLQLATVAEQSGFTQTATGFQVETYLRRLSETWPAAQLTDIGQTIEGRPIWALVVEPQVKSDVRPITVLILGGIHSGECDGKEAIMALARDIAQGQQGDWWHALRLVIVPNFNADANERRSVDHRPGQAGPSAGMGLRENAQGLDLNRDFVKLETPEVQALVAAFNKYDVDVLIDTHTTNGSLHQYELTYDIPHNPATPAAIDNWLRTDLIPAVTERVAEAGLSTFYYGNFDADHRRWSTYGHEPRYSTEYMGLRGRIGILAESYSYASYQTRVNASYAFVREVLAHLASSQQLVRQLIDEASATTARSASSQVALQVPLRAELAKTADSVLVRGYASADGSPPRGPYGPTSAANHTPKPYIVEFFNRAAPTKQVALPPAYAIPAQHAWAVSRLQKHGVPLKRLTSAVQIQCEAYRVTKLNRSPSFQGHRMLSLDVESRDELLTLQAGTYIVDTSGGLGILAAYLLEPESDDSLAKWNFLDPYVAVGKDYPILRLKERPQASQTEAVVDVEPAELLTVELLMKPSQNITFSADSVHSASWLKGSAEYVVSGDGSTSAVQAATGAVRNLHELTTLAAKLQQLDAFSGIQAKSAATLRAFADDGAHALVEHERDLFYFDSADQTVKQLTHSADEDESLAELNPQGSMVAFVRANNLCIVDCQSSELKQLTSDGSEQRLNGILDWVYQEELYGRGKFKAFWWSPDGRQLAFLKLNQTPVDTYRVSDSTSYLQTSEATRYPKAGAPLPTVNVWIADIATGQLNEIDLTSYDATDRLIGRVAWSPQGDLWLQVLNRVQNRQDLLRVNPASRLAGTILSETTPGWISIHGMPHFLKDGNFLWLSDLPTGRTQLFHVDASSGQRRPLTSGDWDVTELHSVSADQQTAFVSGNISHPTESQLVAVDLASGAMRQITNQAGTHRVQVDASSSYYLDTFSSTDSPPVLAVHSIDGQLVRVLDAATSDRHRYVKANPPTLTTITARDGVELQASVMLPAGLDLENPTQKLPVLFYVYGGPRSPTVSNSWGGRNAWWHQMLCQQGFAVVLCDNRAALGNGVKDTWAIRGDMGRVELQDLEDAVGWVRQQAWADADRVGLWGWSYGGYFTAYAMTHSQLFKAGIAGAPVTDWRNYDAIYTERYMDLPQNNQAGYDSSSVVTAAANLHGQLMLIHGEQDDNVHVSNTLQLAYALQKAGKQFDLMLYPKNRHGIVDAEQRYHLHCLMTQFLSEHLKGPP